MIRWIEANGYDVSYTSNVDTASRGPELLEHKIFMSSGHDEYWSNDMRNNVEGARDNAVNLIFFSGNEVFWKTRWENSSRCDGYPVSDACLLQGNSAERQDRSESAVDRDMA